VSSNVIVGLGETDAEVLGAVERLASLGAVANLRPLELSPAVEAALVRALGGGFGRPSAERLLHLARGQRDVLARHGLDGRSMVTMCEACTGCDLAPGRDL
jgi:biotin synthase-related radical SAM superfamily protein